MRVKYGEGTKDVPLTEVTTENYIVPKGEESLYHVVQEMKQFDQKTGKRLSRPVLQKYDAKVWAKQKKALLSWGYDLVIVHDPAEFIRKRDEEMQRAADERRRLAQEAEQKRKADERAALKAELKAELLKEMKADGKGTATKKSNNKK